MIAAAYRQTAPGRGHRRGPADRGRAAAAPIIADGLARDRAAARCSASSGESGLRQDDRRAGAARPRAPRPARIAGGSILLGDSDILAHEATTSCGGCAAASSPTCRRIRPRLAQPGAADRHPAACEVLEAHGSAAARQAHRERIAEVMREVLLPDDPAYLRRYPHQLSGGQQQRVGIAMAFASRPQADRARRADHRPRRDDAGAPCWPPSASSRGPTAPQRSTSATTSPSSPTLADRVAVMYAGRVVEDGPADGAVRRRRRTPTRAGCVGRSRASPAAAGLVGIPGPRAVAGQAAEGCIFAPRCALRDRRLPTRNAPAGRGRAGAQRALHPRGRGARLGSGARRRATRSSCAGRRRARGADAARRGRALRHGRGAALDRPARSSSASAWPWSASRAAARRRSRAPSPVCTASGPARSCSTAQPLANSARGAQRRVAPRRSSTSSRTRTAR